jgi:hypothetical protein
MNVDVSNDSCAIVMQIPTTSMLMPYVVASTKFFTFRLQVLLHFERVVVDRLHPLVPLFC